jgi:hypothetical protein
MPANFETSTDNAGIIVSSGIETVQALRQSASGGDQSGAKYFPLA